MGKTHHLISAVTVMRGDDVLWSKILTYGNSDGVIDAGVYRAGLKNV